MYYAKTKLLRGNNNNNNNNNNSVEKSHWECNSASAGEQNFHLVCNLEFHYRIYKCSPLEFTLNLLGQIQNLTLLWSVLILSSSLPLHFQICLFPPDFSTKIL
jgi:hypothetical protein